MEEVGLRETWARRLGKRRSLPRNGLQGLFVLGKNRVTELPTNQPTLRSTRNQQSLLRTPFVALPSRSQSTTWRPVRWKMKPARPIFGFI